MEAEETVAGAGAAARACAECQRRKRRCDKRLPSCSLCLKMGRLCDYSDHASQSSHDIGDLRRRLEELEERVPSSSGQTTPWISSATDGSRHGTYTRPLLPLPDFVTQASYLDTEVWSNCNIPVHDNPIAAPREVMILLGSESDIEGVKSRYFQSVHAWSPIISKIRLGRTLDQTSGSLKADIALLLLCMKLVQEAPQEQQTGMSECYTVAKHFSKELEIKGLMTLRTVQAGLLLSIYELGHGIYPGAFLTISYCARTAVALGLHNRQAPQLTGKIPNWVNWEERQRVWWMVVILDRHVMIGASYRPLCTEDPDKDTLLPADDNAWDSGEVDPPDRVSLSSRSSGISPFACLAQASNLLGRVIRHCNDTTLELSYVLENCEILCQALFSLIELLPSGGTSETEMSIATTMCYSALFKLLNHHCCGIFHQEGQRLEPDAAPRLRECTQRCLDLTKQISWRVVSFVQDLSIKLTHPTAMERLSPLMLHCIYDCAANLAWLSLETNNKQYAMGRRTCEDMLRSMNARWKVAGVYLEMLRMIDKDQFDSG